MSLATAVERRIGKFILVQCLANTAWAFVTAIRSEEKLCTALARATVWRLCELSAQNFANTAWAFDKMRQSDQQLFAALARAAERCVYFGAADGVPLALPGMGVCFAVVFWWAAACVACSSWSR